MSYRHVRTWQRLSAMRARSTAAPDGDDNDDNDNDDNDDDAATSDDDLSGTAALQAEHVSARHRPVLAGSFLPRARSCR